MLKPVPQVHMQAVDPSFFLYFRLLSTFLYTRQYKLYFARPILRTISLSHGVRTGGGPAQKKSSLRFMREASRRDRKLSNYEGTRRRGGGRACVVEKETLLPALPLLLKSTRGTSQASADRFNPALVRRNGAGAQGEKGRLGKLGRGDCKERG